ncbi:MAG: hypothetical protein IKC57_00375 [Alistipes sp.]|nr:hypothetical protein [Alistipes sp.]
MNVELYTFELLTYIEHDEVTSMLLSAFTVKLVESLPSAAIELFDAVIVNVEGTYSTTVIVSSFERFVPFLAYTVYVPGYVELNDAEPRAVSLT